MIRNRQIARSLRTLKASLVPALFFGLVLNFLHPVSAQSGPIDRAEVGAFLDGLLASQMEAKHIVGGAATVVKDGRILFAGGYGYSDLEARLRFDPEETLFRAGSVSKLFVWTAVMQLVERGSLSLDEDVNGYLDFKLPSTYADPVTLRCLMSHTGGFEEKCVGLFRLDADHLPTLEEYLKTNLPARVFSPLKVGAYSNYGAALAGYIVERVSLMPFCDFVEKNIFIPLGMTSSTFRQPLPVSLTVHMSLGYNFIRGEYLKGGFEYVTGYPAGSLSTTATDMARFMIAHLQDGRYGETRILEAATARRMHAQSYSADPRITGMAHGFFESVINDRRIISHGGDTFLFHSGLYLLPEHNVGLFIAANSAGGADAADEIALAFLDRYYPAPEAQKPVAKGDFKTGTPMYVGEYYESRSNFTTAEKIFSLASPVSVSIDEKNEVLISADGRVARYIEVEPGLLVNKVHPHDRKVFREEDGQSYIHSSGPSVFVKVPWYGSSGLHLLILSGGMLLFTFTIIGSVIFFFKKMTEKHPSFSDCFPWLLADAFGLGYIVFLLLFLNLLGDLHPAYDVPNVIFEALPWSFPIMKLLPALIWFLGIGMWPSAAMVWINATWNFGLSLFYGLLTVMAFLSLLVLTYWNILF